MICPRSAIGAGSRILALYSTYALPHPLSHISITSCAPRYLTQRSIKRAGGYKQRPRTPLQARAVNPAVALLLLIGGSASYYLSTPSSHEKVLNQDTFVPYTITSREAISATSFIFTVAPQHPNPNPSFLTSGSSKPATWRYPLWSVEFKQPEVQIARNYTPLPPLEGERLEDGKLRFYVRSIPGGEMSTYLARLRVGREVWLRGTHPGFDVATRLGSQRNVVFLAGGTGVAPAMQVAKAVLDSHADARFTLLWAIRSREELQQAPDVPARSAASSSPWWHWLGSSSSRPQPVEVGHPIAAASPLGRELDGMKARYGDRLRIHVGIDDESSQFRESHIGTAMQTSTAAAAPTLPSAPDCQPHNQKFHAPASEFEPAGARPCTCQTGQRGKNLLMVSGPEGFISHYAGPKVWLGGVETQGAVGGVAGELRRRKPGFAADWLVLKL